jgi:hypothetical protein
MKVIVAKTFEADNEEMALDIISKQIEAEGSLEKNTVGMIFCHYEFVLSGVAQYIAKNLPFEVVGASTTIAGYNVRGDDDDDGSGKQIRLILLVMSSDDTEFRAVLSEPITPEMTPKDICKDIFDNVGKQKLGIMILPNIILTNPDDLIDEVTMQTNAQIFGGACVDDSPTYIENCFVIANGEAYRDRMLIVFANGAIDPHFATIVVTKDEYYKKTAVITESVGNEIISLNDRPVTEFLASLGFNLTGSKADAINTAVMLVDDGDGDTYGRSMMYLTPDDHLFVGGRVTQGATISIAKFRTKNVLDASTEVTRQMLAAHPNAKFAFISSCESRHIVLGSETFAGEDMLRTELGDLPFVLAYAGGEFSPSPASTPEKPVNRVFNQSYCLCVIE